jgi:hypothetical protein
MKKVLMIRPKDPVTFWSFNWPVKALGKKLHSRHSHY